MEHEEPTSDHPAEVPARDTGVGDRDILCPRCGYNLRGSVEPRCPECGLGVHLSPAPDVLEKYPSLSTLRWIVLNIYRHPVETWVDGGTIVRRRLTSKSLLAIVVVLLGVVFSYCLVYVFGVTFQKAGTKVADPAVKHGLAFVVWSMFSCALCMGGYMLHSIMATAVLSRSRRSTAEGLIASHAADISAGQVAAWWRAWDDWHRQSVNTVLACCAAWALPSVLLWLACLHVLLQARRAGTEPAELLPYLASHPLVLALCACLVLASYAWGLTLYRGGLGLSGFNRRVAVWFAAGNPFWYLAAIALGLAAVL